MIDIIGRRKLWYSIATSLIIVSVGAIGVWRLNVGIDFTGGSLVELAFEGERPSHAEIEDRFRAQGAERIRVQPAGERRVIVRAAPMSQEVHRSIVGEFSNEATEERFETIGPVIGRELAGRTGYAIGLAILAIVAYVAFAFRTVSRDLPAWAYGLSAIAALVHDALIPVGVFAVLGRFLSVEIDAAFIAAALTIVGYSVNDSIVIFDRVREHLLRSEGQNFAEVVNLSVNESFARSLNTTVTTLLALTAVFIAGGATIRYFALALMIGIGVGAYSSIFVAAPLLVTLQSRLRKS
jgi:preprotein translocase subunit SecF